MKTLIRNSTHGLLLMSLLLVYFALLPGAQAFVTDPDETFSNFNTAAGLEALLAGTPASGFSNTAYGARALMNNIGSGTTTGHSNAAFGGFALQHNVSGFQNTAVGNNAMISNIDGNSNMALGQGALRANLHGSGNVAMGAQAMGANTADNNVAVGFQALSAPVTTSGHTAVGFQALNNATPNSGFLAFGDTAVGWSALVNNTTGTNNVAVGDAAGLGVTDGNGNTFLGVIAGSSVVHANGVVCLGITTGADVSSRTYISNIGGTNQPVGPAGIRVVTVNSANDLIGSTTVAANFFDANFNVVSSLRFKDEIKPLDKGSEVIYALKPVSFRYKADRDPTRTLRAGLIAEDVQKVDPDLVVRDEEGKPEKVRLDSITGMLLNEFLKEHKKVEEQQVSIAELKSTVALQQKDMQVLTAQLKEQAAQIQRVSAQIEVGKTAPRTVANK